MSGSVTADCASALVAPTAKVSPPAKLAAFASWRKHLLDQIVFGSHLGYSSGGSGFHGPERRHWIEGSEAKG
jgi:hypothetical protein